MIRIYHVAIVAALILLAAIVAPVIADAARTLEGIGQ